MISIKIDIDDIEEKALGLEISDISSWLNNFVKNRIRQIQDKIVDQSENVLEDDDKKAINQMAIDAGISIFSKPRDYPEQIKREIVKRAKWRSE